MIRVMMTAIVTATTMTTTDTLAATTASVLDPLGVEVGETRLVDVRMVAQMGSVMSLILTGQSGSNVTMTTPLVIVAPCLTQSSI